MVGRGPKPGPRRDLKNAIVDLEHERDQARDLAKLMYSILEQFPTSPGDYHDALHIENLPDWMYR